MNAIGPTLNVNLIISFIFEEKKFMACSDFEPRTTWFASRPSTNELCDLAYINRKSSDLIYNNV